MNQNELKGLNQAQPLSPLAQMGLRELNEKNVRKLLSLDLDAMNFRDEETLKLKNFLISLYLSKDNMGFFYGDMVVDAYEPEPNFIRNALVTILTPFSEEVFELDRMHKNYREDQTKIKETFVLKELENLLMFGSVEKPRFNFSHTLDNQCLFDIFVNGVPQEQTFTAGYIRQLRDELSSYSNDFRYNIGVNGMYGTRVVNMRRSIKSMTRLRNSLKRFDVVNEYSREQWLKLVRDFMWSYFGGESALTETMVLWNELAYIALSQNEVIEIKLKINKFDSEILDEECPQEKYNFENEQYGISGSVTVSTDRMFVGVKEIHCDIKSKYGIGNSTELEIKIHKDSSKNDEKLIESASTAELRCYNHIDKRYETVTRVRLCFEFV